jgi:hypothetical protein
MPRAGNMKPVLEKIDDLVAVLVLIGVVFFLSLSLVLALDPSFIGFLLSPWEGNR